MTLITLALLCFLMKQSPVIEHTSMDFQAQKQACIHAAVEIDSLDLIVINVDEAIVDGEVIQVPVYISSDEQINTLDFSMLMDTLSLDYESVIVHVEDIQYAAHRAKDSKFRFTSNSFAPYPIAPQLTVSIRFKSLKGIVTKDDFKMLVGYLNGDKCTIILQMHNEEIFVSSKEIVTNELFISPNPATDYIYVKSDEDGTLDMFDLQGKAVISGYRLTPNEINSIAVYSLPRGTYTIRMVTKDHTVKTQKMLLQ